MTYIEYQIKLENKDENFSEIVVAFLSELGFDSFSEENNILFSYIKEAEEKIYKGEILALIKNFNIEYKRTEIEQINWNAQWESNYQPVVIDKILAIKAPFHHENFDTEYTIEIEPKMSFGTGHHETTELICRMINKISFENKTVLDMGGGTGILGIFAALKGAKSILSIDIEEWAAENAAENARKNNITNFKSILGDKNSIPDENFDVIFANINLNVLKNDIPDYIKHLNKDGLLILSGFFESEIPQIKDICENNNLQFSDNLIKNSWTACCFKK